MTTDALRAMKSEIASRAKVDALMDGIMIDELGEE
jgi:hypothetical protein